MKKSMNDLFEKFSIEQDSLTCVKAGASKPPVRGDTSSDHGNGPFTDDFDSHTTPAIIAIAS